MEYADWPHECDAVTVLGGDIPRVFVRRDLPLLRERFTLAHELAHIELAWHVGTVDCKIDSAAIDGDYSNSSANVRQEREANEFASRLLAPDRWLKPLTSGIELFERTSMQAILDELARAEMSAHAGLIALSRHLLPGHAFFIDEHFAISRGTARPGQAPLSELEIEQYLENTTTVEEFSHQGRKILWSLTTSPVAEDSGEPSDARTPHQVLMMCCERIFGEEQAQAKAWSINGVVGGMTNDIELDWNEAAIISVVRQRIQGRSDLSDILLDPEFPIYLQKRAQAIVKRRSKPLG
ncbi:ImmA/IrrE family metallo-endopeptidase [Streptomyces virginiae]|uniref:ImmA/IrrE family metallo-endopeptidase n=1 Tax=Streptomyces virginiae TaxID=1961 RepID=UPI0035D53ED2